MAALNWRGLADVGSIPRLLFRAASHPAVFVLALAIAGIALHYRWLTATPLAVADWLWVSPEELKRWFPWPTVWQPELGFGGKAFAGIYLFPTYSVSGLLGRLGLDWGVVEKIVYFLPFAVLSVLSPWVFAKEILQSNRWATLSALVFSSNTYLLILSAGGDIFLAMAEAIAPLVLFGFYRTLKRGSVRWAIATGLSLTVQSAFEIRITYLTLLVAFLYLGILAVTGPLAALFRRLALAGVALIVFAGTQLYWLIPLAAYSGNAGLPFADSPWISFMNLAHGITGLHPFWTGGQQTIFEIAVMNPFFFILPIVAMSALLARRLSPEALWLTIASLAAAFLIKQNAPPLGGIYDWMFSHVPGWRMFREASKLYFIVALGQSILIPLAFRQMLQIRPKQLGAVLARCAGAIAAIGVLGIALSNLFPLATGALGYTLQPPGQPPSFLIFHQRLSDDQGYGAVLWVGGPVVNSGATSLTHNFSPGSQRHPVVYLLGTEERNDPLVTFCREPNIPYCYLRPPLIQYLISRTGASYLVAPAGDRVGFLPDGLTQTSILSGLTATLGTPELLGTGETSIAVWHVKRDVLPAQIAPGVAVVGGTAGLTEDALPALQALGLPTVYRFSSGSLPQAADRLPESVNVLPGIDGTYRLSSGGSYFILAGGNRASLTITNDSRETKLLPVGPCGSLPDCQAYGPIPLSTGAHRLSALDGLSVGPLIESSPLSLNILRDRVSTSGMAVEVQPERVAIQQGAPANSWVEIKRSYDVGWHMAGSNISLLGDGLFNLYFVPSAAKPLVNEFATSRWEVAGVALSLMWALLCLALVAIYSIRRSTRRLHLSHRDSPIVPNAFARTMALAGLSLLVLAFIRELLAWLAVPSHSPQLVALTGAFTGSNPYDSGEFQVAIAILAFALAASTTVLQVPVRSLTASLRLRRKRSK